MSCELRTQILRDALEIPDCDCPPMWWGEYYDRNGHRQRVQLCQSRPVAEESFREFLKELTTETKVKHTGDLICFYPICEHVLSANHPLSVAEWVDFLAKNWPEDYPRDHQLPSPTHTWPGTKARVAIYARRQKNHQSIFHSSDLKPEQHEHLHREVGRRRNGSTQINGIGIAGED